MFITLFGTEQKIEFNEAVSANTALKAFDLAVKPYAVKINGGQAEDLSTIITEDAVLTPLAFDSEEGRIVYRHTTSHLLAMAVKELYPEAKLAIGPAIEDGFYYDFDIDVVFGSKELEEIEKTMKKLAKKNIKSERFTLPRAEAIAKMEALGEPYKVELIQDLPEGEEISFYQMGDFVDLCRGPHLPFLNMIKAIKLTQAAGAYWRGSEKNKMLKRIYGTSFDTKEALDAFITAQEEARKRDHNKIGRELEFFTTTDYIGQGLPIMLPKGTKTLQILQRFVEDEEERRGYTLTKTPLMAKRDLYKISGHWAHYRKNMFIIGDPDDETAECFALRPMTCPFQFQHFLNRTRSYRDLPMRLNETSTLFRNESSGEMHGLIRLRQFTISEGHIICTQEQVENEFAECVKLAKDMLATLGLDDDVSYRFSLWDEDNRDKYIGDPQSWENTQNFMRDILNDIGIEFKEAKGEAAFYGPKLDIQIKNVFGKEDTLITVQVDFQLAERFGMEFTDKDGEKKHPIIIHRTSIGCYERTLALLLEKYNGALPMWMNPEQVRILTITDRQEPWANEVLAKLKAAGVRATADFRNEKIGYKIREARMQRLPYMLILGDKESDTQTLTVRDRAGESTEGVNVDAFVSKVLLQIATKEKY
ncbi:MAG: threonine--tRNA ligase [Eubacteriales bacterium]|nr:threonine--tRNA ligase [Eubacteriales bacterium]